MNCMKMKPKFFRILCQKSNDRLCKRQFKRENLIHILSNPLLGLFNTAGALWAVEIDDLLFLNFSSILERFVD
ncbi:unnamed protein product [Onchocerca flexuosa]|uniref:Uncharacterized protein n=1 Tax=Onchocerca flexuosa TaxID=387005 RepID=A0A183H3C7_9BILA|nr:unnamed protein product [Onchocerca flexuosa]